MAEMNEDEKPLSDEGEFCSVTGSKLVFNLQLQILLLFLGLIEMTAFPRPVRTSLQAT
jgi:hypothetical protein